MVGGERKREDKSLRHYACYSRNNHTSVKCWDKFSKHEWARLLTLHLYLLQLLPPPLLLLMCRYPS